MIKVGITGEMGSGKSHCCALFATLGVPVFLTDLSARRMMNENDDVKYMLKKMISPEIYKDDGTIDRDVLQVKLFECDDAEKNRFSLNISLYPYVKADYERFLEENKTAAYTILESAILFESGWFEMFDYIIYVHCPEEDRIKRVEKRSNLSADQQLARTKNQINYKLKMRASDFILENHGFYSADKQVDHINKELIDKVFADM